MGLPAFQLPMSENCDSLPKGDLFDMFVSGIHSRHSFWEFQASTLYQKLQVPESGSTLHQLCIMVASCLQEIELWYPRFGLQDTDCDLGCLIYDICDCCKPMKKCRDSAFSRSVCGLEVGLPAFQLPMFAKCDALPKGDFVDMFV